mmetsp:Transcript_45786/g.99466  ORF Transcript_45786/g.99466 Transcript_45786/m.99466 type:complete len:203 (+) Transcript_45786:301-909(+)
MAGSSGSRSTVARLGRCTRAPLNNGKSATPESRPSARAKASLSSSRALCRHTSLVSAPPALRQSLPPSAAATATATARLVREASQSFMRAASRSNGCLRPGSSVAFGATVASASATVAAGVSSLDAASADGPTVGSGSSKWTRKGAVCRARASSPAASVGQTTSTPLETAASHSSGASTSKAVPLSSAGKASSLPVTMERAL